MPGQGLRSGGRDPVGTAPVLRGQRLDPATLLKPAQRPVQSARPELGAREPLDVLSQRVAVFRPVRQAGQHEHYRFGELHTALLTVIRLLRATILRSAIQRNASELPRGYW